MSMPRSMGNQQQTGGNLSELDSLLQDLSTAQYGANLEKRSGSQPPLQQYPLNDSIKRPSVDSLLDELSNAHSGPIYAVPNG